MKLTLLTGKTYDISEAVGMDIKVIQSPTARRLTLRIDSKTRTPVLSVPRFCSRKHAIKFVEENMDWIVRSLSKIPEQKYFSDGEQISLFGEILTICHCPHERGGVWRKDNFLCVSGGAEFIHRRIKDYIKNLCRQKFLELSRVKAAQINRHIHSISIKDTKSRWGSCSSLNNINYNWRIALAPAEAINYLIAHEVAHLEHPDHSKQFWDCVGLLNPDWKHGHDWLKKHGKTLYMYK
ncbi:MAG: M48 family metallopeptidase [Alphaproteobacteria bacterium]|nr:M48 family metallopeptidase [Alphaproteobacteria bacterium]